jgi:two-component system, NarL family, sensor histidine kinase BarA
MKADFGVESELGKGSTFWFEIKLKNPSTETILPQKEINFKDVFLIHPDKSYSEYLGELFVKLRMNCKFSMDEIDLKEKTSLLLIDEDVLQDLPEDIIPGDGMAFIIGDSTRIGFRNLNNPLSISELFDVLMLQKDQIRHVSNQLISSSVRILLVDDNLMILKSLENLLNKLDLGTIHIATNGEEALKIIKSESQYDIIFMDIQMPVKDGITAVQELRELSDLKKSNTPVVALTGNSISHTKSEQCKIWKMEDILMKPVNKKELLNCIQKILQIK